MIKYIKENKQWIFSGIGVLGISLLISIVLYIVWGRGSETRPPAISTPPDTQVAASPNIVAKSSSSAHMPTTEPRPIKPTRDSQPDNNKTKDEAQFNQLLKEARKLLGVEQYRPACQLYRQAVGILPASKRGEVNFGSIGEANSNYDRDEFRSAANKYAEAFQKVSIQ